MQVIDAGILHAQHNPPRQTMKRRDALVSLAVSGAGVLWAGCGANQAPTAGLTEQQVGLLVRELTGSELQPGQASQVLASLKGNRFTADVDPTIQPQSDFDADTDR
jgi:hypothetical protein